MTERLRVAVVAYTDAESDPRIRKQLLALSTHFDLSVIAVYPPTTIGEIRFLPIKTVPKTSKSFFERLIVILKTLLFPEKQYFSNPLQRQLVSHLRHEAFDVIIANDMTLPACIRYRGNAKVVFDAHEYYLDSQKNLRFRISNARPRRILLEKYLPMADELITVSDGLADLYRNIGGTYPEVVHNTVWYVDQQPRPKSENETKIRLIHHGGGMYRRRIDRLIALMDLLDARFELDLMLIIRDPSYKEHIETLIDDSSATIRLVEPVPLEEVSRRLNEYDIGIHMLWGDAANHRFAMPNKLFEFVQGRLAVAVSPNPNMADFVRRHQVGIVSECVSIESMAIALNAIDHTEINRFKANSHSIASKFTAEATQEQYLSIVNRALSRNEPVS